MLKRDRLAAFEKMLGNIQKRHREAKETIDTLQAQERIYYTVEYKKLVAENLVLQKMLSMYAIYGIIETDFDTEEMRDFLEKEPIQEPALTLVKARIDEFSETPIEELKISNRGINCLIRKHIYTIGELLKLTDKEIIEIRNLGPNTLAEIQQAKKEVISEGLKYLEKDKCPVE